VGIFLFVLSNFVVSVVGVGAGVVFLFGGPIVLCPLCWLLVLLSGWLLRLGALCW
jgi:hypothetical protein